MFELTTTRMKRSNFLILLILLGVSASFWQCGGDSTPTPDPKDQQIAKLSKLWTATNVTYNSSPASGYVNNADTTLSFHMKITGTSGQTQIPFTTTNRPAGTANTPWPSTGNFEFGSDFATVLNRTDITGGLSVTYSVSDKLLQMTFDFSCPNCTPYNGSRVNSVNGIWTFTFARK